MQRLHPWRHSDNRLAAAVWAIDLPATSVSAVPAVRGLDK